jgi:iron(III) transport system substrate-binding protein
MADDHVDQELQGDGEVSRRDFIRTGLGAGTMALLAACAPGSQQSAGSAAPAINASANPEFKQLVDAANKEGEVIFWSLAIPARQTLDQMVPAFNKRFGTNIKVTLVPVDARELPNRIIAEAKQPVATGDVSRSGIDAPAITLAAAGVLKVIPWVELFGAELPGIKDRVDHVMAPATGAALEAPHIPYGIVYNPTMINKQDLPKSWEDLGDPKWSGKIVTDPGGGSFGWLGLSLGEQRLIDLVTKIKANKPIFSQSSPDSVQRVLSGQAPIAVAVTDCGEAQKRLGAPVDWVMIDPVPDAQQTWFLPPNPVHPNAAQLWCAWIATEGLTMLEKLEGRGLPWPGNGNFADAVQAQKLNLALAQNVDQVKTGLDLRAKVAKVFAG